MDRIILNVGGTRYETTLTTVRNIGPYFVNLCAPESPFRQQDGNEYFVDRDPDLFKYVLAYARTKRLDRIVHDVQGLLIEAEYFGFDDLITYVKKRSNTKIRNKRLCSALDRLVDVIPEIVRRNT